MKPKEKIKDKQIPLIKVLGFFVLFCGLVDLIFFIGIRYTSLVSDGLSQAMSNSGPLTLVSFLLGFGLLERPYDGENIHRHKGRATLLILALAFVCGSMVMIAELIGYLLL